MVVCDVLLADVVRLGEAAEILKLGGVGVIPTDTCYTFACDILSRKGLERVRLSPPSDRWRSVVDCKLQE